MSRTCSQCGNNGHNSRTCADGGGGCSGEGTGGIMLFGVRLTAEGSAFRKSASMTDLSQYEHTPEPSNVVDAGYASDDVVHPSGRGRERKRGNWICSTSWNCKVRWTVSVSADLMHFLIR